MNACGVRDGWSGDMLALSWCNLALESVCFLDALSHLLKTCDNLILMLSL